jgi:hypothetical protein
MQLYGDACALLRRYWYRLGTRRYVQELFERTPLTAAYITDPTPTAPSPALVRPPRLHTNTHMHTHTYVCICTDAAAAQDRVGCVSMGGG